jgi:hypothetical protein
MSVETPLVWSVSIPVNDTDCRNRLCPEGHEKLPGPGGVLLIGMLPVTCPFRPELNCPLPLTGEVTVSLLAALG